jgi:hypothetical protein
MSSDAAAAATSASQENQAASTSGLPAAAKAAAELAVKTAISESVPEDGEINEDDESSTKKENGENGTASSKDESGIRTVFSDPANFNVVHPLYSKWYAYTKQSSSAKLIVVYMCP